MTSLPYGGRILPVPVEDTLELRDKMLSPGHPGRPVSGDYDFAPGSIHLGVRDHDGAVVACISAECRSFDDSNPDSSYRFHSMAADESLQRNGIGKRLLHELFRRLRQQGASFVWATARPSAVEFYRRSGLKILDEVGAAPITGMSIVYVTADVNQINNIANGTFSPSADDHAGSVNS